MWERAEERAEGQKRRGRDRRGRKAGSGRTEGGVEERVVVDGLTIVCVLPSTLSHPQSSAGWTDRAEDMGELGMALAKNTPSITKDL